MEVHLVDAAWQYILTGLMRYQRIVYIRVIDHRTGSFEKLDHPSIRRFVGVAAAALSKREVEGVGVVAAL